MNSESRVADVVCGLDSLKDLQQGLRNESPAERFDETDETFWNVVKEKYPYARAIYNAFKDDFNARLFIIVVSYGASSKIHFITKQELSPELIITKTDVLIEAKTLCDEIKPQWRKILNNEEQDVIESGNRFQDHLLMGYLFSLGAEFEKDLNERSVSDGLKEEFSAKGFELSKPTLSSTMENREWEITDKKRKYALKIEDETLNIYLKSKADWLNSYITGKYIVPQCANPFGVWVYCEDKDFYPLWEWLYTSKGYGMENQDSFFWGDKFHIIRIPNERILKNCDFEKSNYPCQINNVAMIIDDYECHCTADDKECFKGQRKVEFIKLQEIINGSTNLNAFDCIHLVLSGRLVTKQLLSSCRQALRNCKLNFLFLNIRAPNDCSSELLTKFKKLFTSSAEIWIDSLDLPNDSAPQFTKYFYKELWSNKENVAATATKTRKNIERNTEELNSRKKLWRLAYVVTGNPCTKISWATD